MSTSFSANVGLGTPAVADRGWNTVVDANTALLDSLSPIGGLCVQAKEHPSTTLNVKVAAGSYPKSDGSKGTYAGTPSQAVAASSTKVIYLDSSGTLTVGASYPTAAAHVPLATVVTGSSTITSVADNRVPGGIVLRTLGGYANDAAAAAGGVPIGGLYHTSGAVYIRLA